MAFNYPYGDTQQLNLNWFLAQWETFREQWATAEEGIDHALDAEIARVEAAMTDLYAARDAAAASKTAAQTAATNAASSATVATQQATLAQSYANTAQTQAGIATAAAEAAGNSASSASTSATAANLSKTQAANSATAAQTAQTAAEAAETNIVSIITDAIQDAADAAAATATADAEAAADAAEASATAAAGSASDASDSATAAAGSASDAADSATAAAGSATAAAGSATAAAGSASSAADSATAAAASAASIVVDSAMSDSSTNPVQNKVINGEITELKTALISSYNNNYNFNKHSTAMTQIIIDGNERVSINATTGAIATTASNYRTYKYKMPSDGSIYLDTPESGNYTTIAIYNGEPSSSTLVSGQIYRKTAQSNTLPTSENPLSVNKDYYICVCFIATYDFGLHIGMSEIGINPNAIMDGTISKRMLDSDLSGEVELLVETFDAQQEYNKYYEGFTVYKIEGNEKTVIKSTGNIETTESNYNTYLLTAKYNCSIYFDEPESGNTVSMGVYDGNPSSDTLVSTKPYRNTDNTAQWNILPYSSTPLSVASGNYIAISVLDTKNYNLHISIHDGKRLNPDSVDDGTLTENMMDDGVTAKLTAVTKMMNRSRMKFAAHRGVELYAPENSIPAYEMAGKQGWEWAWIAQLKYSADGTLYVLHDTTVNRTTNVETVFPELVEQYPDGVPLAELEDTQIESLRIDYCPDTARYQLSDFDSSELVIPTLEQIVQICVRYGMKMCFRLGNMPSSTDAPADLALWNSFKAIVDGYNIPMEDCCFSGIPTQFAVAKSLFGNDAECSYYISASATPSDYVTWFTTYDPGVDRKSAIIHTDNLDLAGVKTLHNAGIKVYAYHTEMVVPPDTLIDNLANWGTEILQNSAKYYVP